MNGGITALVLGGSGEIGKQLVRELVSNASFSHIILVTRRHIEIDNEKIEQRIVDFEKLDDHKDAFEGAEVNK